MPKIKKEINKMQEIADFANENKGFLFIVGNPIRDELYISFNGLQKLLKFPETKELSNNVLVQIMAKSSFAGAMSEFLSGLIKTIGVDSEEGLQFYQAIAGTLQSMALGNPKESKIEKTKWQKVKEKIKKLKK